MTDFAEVNALDPSEGRSLHDLVAGNVGADSQQAIEYAGLFLHGYAYGQESDKEWVEGDIYVQADGHVGVVEWLSSEDYDDVLELVDDLNALVLEWENHIEHGSMDDLVEFAGPKQTSDPKKAEGSDHYVHVPDRGVGAES